MNQKISFIIVGVVNTLFGYMCGIIIYFIFYKLLGIIFVGFIVNLLSITFSFFTYRVFVFKSFEKSIIVQYLKSLITYFISGLIGVLILWLCIEYFLINIYISQAIVLIVSVPIVYILHKKFTYK